MFQLLAGNFTASLQVPPPFEVKRESKTFLLYLVSRLSICMFSYGQAHKGEGASNISDFVLAKKAPVL